jgi:crotonobetainyl-CoA:carnitine CoA-transferase CaiB-like acyl-CoA transferase
MTHDHDSLSAREQTSALQGIRVIDFGHSIAGPPVGIGYEILAAQQPGLI